MTAHLIARLRQLTANLQPSATDTPEQTGARLLRLLTEAATTLTELATLVGDNRTAPDLTAQLQALGHTLLHGPSHIETMEEFAGRIATTLDQVVAVVDEFQQRQRPS